MCNPSLSLHRGRSSSSSVQEHHTKPIIIGPDVGGAAEEQVREAMKLLHSPLNTSPAGASDLEPFACAPKKSCKTRALRSHAHFGARFWPLALVVLTFVAQVLFVSSFQLNHPNNQKYMLTKRQEPDQTLPTTTKAGGSFIDQLTESLSLTPLERIALTCSGNLQMVFSSFYLQPVEVSVDRFELALTDEDGNASKSPLAVYDREVCMDIAGQQFCKATSKVRIYDAELDEALTTQQVGIGQLLRMRNLAPKFMLHDAGRNKHGGMWRFYSMDCKDMIEFDILEEFSDNAWNIVQTSEN